MKYDCIYDSSTQIYENKVEIDYENDVAVNVLFEKENIVLNADAHGNAIFSDIYGNVIFKDKAESKSLFGSIYCNVTDNTIIVKFPITKWVDNYPHCDGEYDRWDEIITDMITIACPVTK